MPGVPNRIEATLRSSPSDICLSTAGISQHHGVVHIFPGHVSNLLFPCNFTHHRFAPSLRTLDDVTYTLLLGLGCLLSSFAYWVFARIEKRI
jgi:hypothetical protein